MHYMHIRSLARRVALVLLAVATYPAHATNVRTVALATDSAPIGLPDQRFGFVGTPSINALGQVTFASYLVNESGLTFDSIWSEAGTSGLHLAAREGLPPSDVNDGTTFGMFMPQNGDIILSKKHGVPFANAVGMVAFQASANTGGGVWTESGHITHTVARTTQSVPELPGREHLWVFGPPAMNAQGTTLFQSRVVEPISYDYHTGLFAADASGQPRLVAGGLEQNQIPGRPSGNRYRFAPAPPSVSSSTPFVMNDMGQIAFGGKVSVTSEPSKGSTFTVELPAA